jgi:MYXO-CTERM domain-containing protein
MIRIVMSFWRAVACAVLASGLCAGPASASFSTAQYVPCGSTEGFGSFSAELSYSYMGGTSASISITLTNTTDMSLGGYITALALNPNGTASGLFYVSSSSAAFSQIVAPINASPYGQFAAGAGLGGSFLGGGSPVGGIAVGGSEIFTFALTGSASALAALDAETALAGTGYAMVVRFRGGDFEDWSDKVVGCALPAPGALALLGAAGLVSRRRRRV